MTREEAEALADFKFANEKNICVHAYVQITNDFVAGCILSQIFYWFTPSKDGKSKLRVKKKDGYWLAKSRKDWEKEICISPKQYDRGIKILKELDLIETKLYKFNGAPMVHIRPKSENCNKAVAQWKEKVINELMASENEPENTDEISISPKGKNPFSQKVKMEITEKGKSITDTTTDTTNTNYNNKIEYNRSISKRNITSLSFDVINKQIDTVCNENEGYDSDEIKKIFRYYMFKYKQRQKEDHPKMTTKNISELLNNFYCSEYYYLDFDSIADMIDIHFSRTYKYDVDYNINHFFNENIIGKLVNEIA